MSADNYYLIRRDGERFAVSCLFESDHYRVSPSGEPYYSEQVPPIHKHDKRFNTLKEAEDWAYAEYSEYGVRHEPGLKAES